MKVLFVCTGNTCRSCMAELIGNSEAKKLQADVQFSSAGLFAVPNCPPSKNAVIAMKEMDLDLSSHSAVQVSDELIKNSDLIITMTEAQENSIINLDCSSKNKVFTLYEFIGERGEVSDPFGCNIEIYRSCAQQLYKAIEKLIMKIKES